MERYSMFLGWKNHYCENNYNTQCNIQIQYNPYQITNGVFHRIIVSQNKKKKKKKTFLETEKTLNI